jgi:hypothetical protein
VNNLIAENEGEDDTQTKREERISKFDLNLAQLAEKASKKKRMSYEEYERKKYLLAYLHGDIEEKDYQKRYKRLPSLPKEDYELYSYTYDLEKELEEYEEDINRIDVTAKIETPLMLAVNKIMKRFSEAVAKGQINTKTFESALEQCPEIKECHGTHNST